MFRVVLLLLWLLSLNIGRVTAQSVSARSQDYLFITNVADVRALWVNPAGLALVPEASILGELTFERLGGEQLRVEQYALGFNSRGVSFGYQRSRLVGEKPVSTVSTGFGFPFRGGSLGVTLSRYRQDSTKSFGADFGLIYVPNVSVQLGLAVRHLGRPTVRGADLPVTTVGAAQMTLSIMQLTWETAAAERLEPDESGFDFTHRAGLRLAPLKRLPMMLIGAVDLASNVRIDRLNLGFSIGGARQLTSIGSAVPRNNAPVFEHFSATFVAAQPLSGRSF
ncbi:MAG: hypothetical protein ACE10G_00135 [Gemmatimonadales bacterium]